MVLRLAGSIGMFVWCIGMYWLAIGMPILGLAGLARSRRTLVGRLFFHLVNLLFICFTALLVTLACGGPNGPGYNMITGERATGEPGQFGPTWKNVSKGLEIPASLGILGLALAGLVKLANRAAAGLRKRWPSRGDGVRPPRLARAPNPGGE
jgi:hypothetical protein